MAAPVLVVGVDGSAGAAGALAAAAQLARATHHQVVAVHVENVPAAVFAAPTVGAGDMVTAIDEGANQCHLGCELALAGTDIVWSFEVRAGDPATELVAAGRDHQAACIVVGRRGHSRLARLLVGSVTDRLVHHADRPVLVVPPTPP